MTCAKCGEGVCSGGEACDERTARRDANRERMQRLAAEILEKADGVDLVVAVVLMKSGAISLLCPPVEPVRLLGLLDVGAGLCRQSMMAAAVQSTVHTGKG